jgi:ribosomal protein S18 acetylase RimI-like enzyme
MPPLELHPFDPQDEDTVLWLWRRSFEHGVGIDDPNPSLDGIRGYFRAEILPKDDVHVAKEGNEIVGVVASNRESVSALYVRVDSIGRGIGSALIELAKSRSSGTLWLYTFEKNENARRFYAKHGFEEFEYGFESFWKLNDVKLRWPQTRASAA